MLELVWWCICNTQRLLRMTLPIYICVWLTCWAEVFWLRPMALLPLQLAFATFWVWRVKMAECS